MSTSASCVFSVDVEEWFHILDVPSTPPISQWTALPSRVEMSFRKMLDVFAEKDVKATLFFLAWVAERHPLLVKEAKEQGHEIASHGYAHELVFRIGRERFMADAGKAKQILEDISGGAVRGYRAPGFSVTEDTPWFFETLAEAGYVYDSSVWPGERGHGGWPGAPPTPFRVETSAGPISEFPISLGSMLGRKMFFFGGGYMRFFPYALIRNRAQAVLNEDRPVIFYLHPREVDPGHPRLAMSAKRRFMSYYNLSGTQGKMERLLRDLPMTTLGAMHDKAGKELPLVTM